MIELCLAAGAGLLLAFLLRGARILNKSFHYLRAPRQGMRRDFHGGKARGDGRVRNWQPDSLSPKN